jgi:hypothetical protein
VERVFEPLREIKEARSSVRGFLAASRDDCTALTARRSLQFVDKLAETAVNRKVGTRDIHERVVLDTVAFLCHVLATLEYKYDEPLRIVHKIDRRLGASTQGYTPCLSLPCAATDAGPVQDRLEKLFAEAETGATRSFARGVCRRLTLHPRCAQLTSPSCLES